MATPQLQNAFPVQSNATSKLWRRKALQQSQAASLANRVVIDVDRRIEGREAIKQWAASEVIGGVYHIVRAELADNRVSVLLTFAPRDSESFRARYDFEIHEEKVVMADLQYALT